VCACVWVRESEYLRKVLEENVRRFCGRVLVSMAVAISGVEFG
jgi:hypothetical protein